MRPCDLNILRQLRLTFDGRNVQVVQARIEGKLEGLPVVLVADLELAANDNLPVNFHLNVDRSDCETLIAHM